MTKTSMFAKLTAESGRRDEIVAALEAAMPAVEGEAGTEVYSFHLDAADPDAVWLFELYADDDALGAHGAGEALAGLLVALDGVLSEPPLMVVAKPAAAKGLDV